MRQKRQPKQVPRNYQPPPTDPPPAPEADKYESIEIKSELELDSVCNAIPSWYPPEDESADEGEEEDREEVEGDVSGQADDTQENQSELSQEEEESTGPRRSVRAKRKVNYRNMDENVDVASTSSSSTKSSDSEAGDSGPDETEESGNPFTKASCKSRSLSLKQMEALKLSNQISLSLRKKRPFPCPHPGCYRSYTVQKNLNEHRWVHTNKFKCKKCGRCTRSRFDLENHNRLHTGEMPHECPTCGKLFHQKGFLEMHQRAKHNPSGGPKSANKDVKCPKCPATFTGLGYLTKHYQRAHTDVRQFKCAKCPKAFTDASKLKIHLRTHSGERPFKCSDCGRAFGDLSNWRRHRRSCVNVAN